MGTCKPSRKGHVPLRLNESAFVETREMLGQALGMAFSRFPNRFIFIAKVTDHIPSLVQVRGFPVLSKRHVFLSPSLTLDLTVGP